MVAADTPPSEGRNYTASPVWCQAEYVIESSGRKPERNSHTQFALWVGMYSDIYDGGILLVMHACSLPAHLLRRMAEQVDRMTGRQGRTVVQCTTQSTTRCRTRCTTQAALLGVYHSLKGNFCTLSFCVLDQEYLNPQKILWKSISL